MILKFKSPLGLIVEGSVIEIDERHFRTAVERVKRELAQPMLPAMTPQMVEQQDLIT